MIVRSLNTVIFKKSFVLFCGYYIRLYGINQFGLKPTEIHPDQGKKFLWVKIYCSCLDRTSSHDGTIFAYGGIKRL